MRPTRTRGLLLVPAFLLGASVGPMVARADEPVSPAAGELPGDDGAEPPPGESASPPPELNLFDYLPEMPRSEDPAPAGGEGTVDPALTPEVNDDEWFGAVAAGSVVFGLSYIGDLSMWGLVFDSPEGMPGRWGWHWLPVAGPIVGLVDLAQVSCGEGETSCWTTVGLMAAFDVLFLLAQSASLAALVWGIVESADADPPAASGGDVPPSW